MEGPIAAVAVVLWGSGVLFFRAHRIWLLYYTLGAVGLAFLLVYVVQSLPSGVVGFETVTAYGAHYVATALHIPTRIFQAAPNTVLVLVIAQEIGWTALQVGIECSGLLETAIFVGLLAFYPGWPWQRKSALIMAGLGVTYLANIGRMLVIIFLLHRMGKDWLLFAHTLVGKFVFFALVIAMYWYLLTLPTIVNLAHRLKAEEQP